MSPERIHGAMAAFGRALDADAVPMILDHAHRLLVCGLLFAVGVFARQHPMESFGIAIFAESSGIGIMGMAALLTFLNLCDGVHRLARLRHPLLLTILLVAVYLVLSLRLVLFASGAHS